MTNTVLAPPQRALARRHSGFYTLQYFTMSRIDVSSSDNRKTAVCYKFRNTVLALIVVDAANSKHYKPLVYLDFFSFGSFGAHQEFRDTELVLIVCCRCGQQGATDCVLRSSYSLIVSSGLVIMLGATNA